MSELYTFFKEHGPVFVSTCADNEATVRPFGFVDLVEGKIVFATSAYGRCCRQLRANPHFEASSVDMSTYSWARISAVAEEVTGEAKEAVIAANPNLANFKGAENIFMFKAAEGEGAIMSLAGAPTKNFTL